MKRYVLCMVVAVIGGSPMHARSNLQTLQRLNRPENNRISQRPTTAPKPERIRPLPVAKPPQHRIMRVMHIAQGEYDKKELAAMIKGITCHCVTCFGVDKIKNSLCDVAIISDMSALHEVAARADKFKKLIVWICNRCTKDEYEQIKKLAVHDNVHIVVNTPYEKWYIQSRNITTDRVAIVLPRWSAPVSMSDRETLFLCAGLKESHLKRVIVACAAQGIRVRDESSCAKAYCGASENMFCVPGIVPDHLLFELLKQGVVPFVPTIRFLKRLGFVSLDVLSMIHTSEWYQEEYAGFVHYFNSWSDLKVKMQETDYAAIAKKIECLGMQKCKDTAMSWKQLLENLMSSDSRSDSDFI